MLNIIIMEDLIRAVGGRLKESRRLKNMTQKQVAELLFMTQQQYSRFENGIFELNYQQLIFLCKLYDISSDYLLGLNEF
ncbi:MAG: helix-turn-helix domain-containing protein [Firmicutes bacterium]|nr:helix-turn-helix domain-containing protein [Bacillota bacterium]